MLGLHRTATRLPTPVLRSVFASPALRALALGMILARPERMAVEAALADARALRHARAFRAVARAGRGMPSPAHPTASANRRGRHRPMSW